MYTECTVHMIFGMVLFFADMKASHLNIIYTYILIPYHPAHILIYQQWQEKQVAVKT